MDALITYYIEISVYKLLNDMYTKQHRKVIDTAKNTGAYKESMIEKMEQEYRELNRKGEVLGKIIEELDGAMNFERAE